MLCLTMNLDDGTQVTLWSDARVQVKFGTKPVAKHELHGYVYFEADGNIAFSKIEDAYDNVPLRPHVIRAAQNYARKQARFARRAARQIAATTKPVTRACPGTLEHLVLLAEGKIREDGWPRGYLPL